MGILVAECAARLGVIWLVWRGRLETMRCVELSRESVKVPGPSRVLLWTKEVAGIWWGGGTAEDMGLM